MSFFCLEILELLGIFQRISWISHPKGAGADELSPLSLSQKVTQDVEEMLPPGEGQYCLSYDVEDNLNVSLNHMGGNFWSSFKNIHCKVTVK